MDGSTRIPAAGRQMRRRASLLLYGLIAIWVAAAIDVAAQSALPIENAFTLDARPPRLLVLFDGRVLEGTITECPGGYRIESQNGNEVIPFNFIRLAAASLDDAYIKQRDALQKPTASDHLSLAEWCYEYKLYAHATEQLTATLKLEPNRTAALDLLKNIAEISPEQVGGSLKFVADPATQSKTSSGLTPAGQAEFVRRVQPILINRCGDARCHGSAANNHLKLINIRTGRRQQRLESETNLAAVLKMIDRQSPEQSPLLRVPQDESSAHRGVFSGKAGPAQLERIRAWVAQIAAELPGGPGEQLWASDTAGGVEQAAFSSMPKTTGRSGVQTADHEVEVESPLLKEIPRTPRPIGAAAMAPAAVESSDAPAGDGGVAIAAAGRRQRAPTGVPKPVDDQKEFLRNILQLNRPDAFDPDEFNRQVHGGGASK